MSSTNAEMAAEFAQGGADMHRAIVYALLAVADAIDGLNPPAEDVPQVPFEQTREGWKW